VLEVDFPDPVITEVYTVIELSRLSALRGGESLTFKTGWNFLLEEYRTQALKLVRQLRPYVLVIAFPCGPWTSIKILNSNVTVVPTSRLRIFERKSKSL